MRISADGAWVAPVIVAMVAAGAVAIMGGTITEIGPWYLSLRQPDWAPPNAAYPIVWTLIYALTAIAGVAGWSAARSGREAEWLAGSVRAQRLPQHPVEPALLSPAPARLGRRRRDCAVALGARADPRDTQLFAARRSAAVALSCLGEPRLRARSGGRAPHGPFG